jgi:hypothetical protein
MGSNRIGWDRIEAATVYDLCTALHRIRMMFIDHLSDPLWLTGKIAIVRSVRNTSADQLASIFRVRPDSRQYNASIASQLRQRVTVMTIGNDDSRGLSRSAILGEHALEFFPVAASDGPADRGPDRIIFRKVLDDQAPGKSGGTNNHNVVRPTIS